LVCYAAKKDQPFATFSWLHARACHSGSGRILCFSVIGSFYLLTSEVFAGKISAAGGETAAVILHGQSWGNIHQLFVYSRSRSLPGGHLSLDEINALGGILDELRGCKVASTYLKDRFYILNVDCR
jgi:hypothetical protein